MIVLVMDTNVLVSGLLSPHSYSARLLRLALDRQVQIAFDERILAEYREVLARPKFPFYHDQIDALLTQIEEEGLNITPPPLLVNLPDPDDLPFLEVAIASKADFLVTGNKKHYPSKMCRGIKVVSPRHGLKLISLELPQLE
jgi:putative PIN family toxin of toxin-antitoxin system